MYLSESVSTALTAVHSIFADLPVYTFYDNACNLVASTILRTQWVHKNNTFWMTGFISDFTSARTYLIRVALGNVIIWKFSSRISQFEASQRHVMFHVGGNIMLFIYVCALFLNLRAHFWDWYNQSDVEDRGHIHFANREIRCSCVLYET